MAPITTTTTGVMPQVLDDPNLVALLSELSALPLVDTDERLKTLAELLEPYKSEWLFEETVRCVSRICPDFPPESLDSPCFVVLMK
jgi:hypothetical protein